MKTCYIKSERTSDCLHALIYLLKPEINQYTMSGGKYESYKWFFETNYIFARAIEWMHHSIDNIKNCILFTLIIIVTEGCIFDN
jgi:hypothetical protein